MWFMACGAGWTFVIWGGLHGILIVINHLFRIAKNSLYLKVPNSLTINIICILLTFFSVTLLWVPVRVDNLHEMISFYELLFGLQGINLPSIGRDYVLMILPDYNDFGVFKNGHIENIKLSILSFVAIFFICFFMAKCYQMCSYTFFQHSKFNSNYNFLKLKWNNSNLGSIFCFYFSNKYIFYWARKSFLIFPILILCQIILINY